MSVESETTIKAGKTQFISYMDNYKSALDDLKSNWQGESYNSLVSQANEFYTEFKTIGDQLDSFTNACNLYREYETASKNRDNYISLANQSKDDVSSQVHYNDLALQCKNKMDSLETQINTVLNDIKSVELTATDNASSSTDVSNASALSLSGNSVGERAVQWALSIADDNRYGYVSGGMGNGGYDCTQFIHAAYEAAGVSLPYKGYVNQTNIVEYYTSRGFEWHPGTPDVNQLQPGDVLVNQQHHAEMYVGDGYKVGAHDNYDRRAGDSQGNEISVDTYKNFANGGWDGYLRYVGTRNV